MDKQKQIEEMARELREIQPLFYASIAEQLYNAGYRKIPEGAVVLKKEAYEKMQALKDDYVKGYEAGVDEGWDNARKETAEKFALKLADYFVEHCGSKLSISLTLQEWYKMIDEICKELTEDDL